MDRMTYLIGELRTHAIVGVTKGLAGLRSVGSERLIHVESGGRSLVKQEVCIRAAENGVDTLQSVVKQLQEK